jgi:hypothetical protein
MKSRNLNVVFSVGDGPPGSGSETLPSHKGAEWTEIMLAKQNFNTKIFKKL